MLDEYKSIFRQCADKIANWEKISKNDLCRKYLEHSDNAEMQNSYLSAIMLRYWNLIGKYYYMSSNAATVEDCYEWLEDSVCYVLREASWDDSSKSLFNDPNGPDKAINRCMKCARLTHYQYINRKKRKDNFGMLSLEELAETFGKSTVEPVDIVSSNMFKDVHIKEYVKHVFFRKDYFLAFMLDCIAYQNCFESEKDSDGQLITSFNMRKFVKVMSHIDDDYLQMFSKKYNIDIADVNKAYSYCSSLTNAAIKRKALNRFEELKHDKFFQLLKEGV